MKPPKLIRTNFRDFLKNLLPDINAGGRGDCETLVAVDHIACNLTTSVFVLPENCLGRCSPDFWSPAQNFDWLSKASTLLDGGGAMQKEFKSFGLRKSDMPMWFLQFHGSDSYSNPNKDLGYRCASVLMPSDQVLPVYNFLCRWFDQFSDHMFLECSKPADLRSGESDLPYGTDYDLLCFPFLRGKIFGRWHGESGLLKRLQRKVAELEAGAARSLAMPPLYMARSASLASGREIFFSRHNKEFLDAHAFEGGIPEHPMNLETLDLIYCLQCRLIRLLEWPQFFVNVKEKLEKERTFSATHPMTVGLPYEPYGELYQYLTLMRQKFPMLEESPYTQDAFLHPPIAKV